MRTPVLFQAMRSAEAVVRTDVELLRRNALAVLVVLRRLTGDLLVGWRCVPVVTVLVGVLVGHLAVAVDVVQYFVSLPRRLPPDMTEEAATSRAAGRLMIRVSGRGRSVTGMMRT